MGCCPRQKNKQEKEEKQKIIIPGLSYFEGNCYLNSILQCLYYCEDLTNYFNDEKNINDNNGKLSKAYLNLIQALNKKEKYNDAKILLNELQKVSNNFFNKGGNDPKAALFYLLENLHNELKEEKSGYKVEDICCEDIDKDKAFQRCKENEKKNESIISKLFNWCLLTKTTCIKCRNVHYMCQYYNHLLIELKNYETDGEVHLDDLIEYYLQDIKKPFVCNNDTEVFNSKVLNRIISLPKYLIIILNRDILQFKIQYNDVIDLSKFCVNDCNAKYSFIGASLTNDYKNNEATHAISRCMTPEGSVIINDLVICNTMKGYNPYILFYKKNDISDLESN